MTNKLRPLKGAEGKILVGGKTYTKIRGTIKYNKIRGGIKYSEEMEDKMIDDVIDNVIKTGDAWSDWSEDTMNFYNIDKEDIFNIL